MTGRGNLGPSFFFTTRSTTGEIQMPNLQTIGKGVLITTISLVVLHFVKPYLPSQVSDLLS